MSAPAATPAVTLAMLGPGESARVERILFGALRTLCGDLGIREGGTVRCRAGTGGVLVLDTEDGHVVSVARDWARFIRVVRPPAAGGLVAARAGGSGQRPEAVA